MILRRSAVLLATAILLTIAGCSFLGEQGPELTYLEPALSPDGRRVAYESTVDGKLDLFARDIETGVAERLTENQADDFSPSWSPDGTSIVFASNRNNNVDIYILDIAMRQTRRLTTDAGTDMNPTWAADGRIYFNSDRTQAWQIYAVLPDGTSLAAITATATP